jgi:xylulose-5-phosphate/fructose-6-phosphate phosphoketolase
MDAYWRAADYLSVGQIYLTYRRHNHHNFRVRGYKEEATTTTPFDMTVMNEIDRYHLAMDVTDRVPALLCTAGHLCQDMTDRSQIAYTHEHGDDPPEVRNWTWPC